MSNYLNPLTEAVFFSASCVVTHSVVCTLCIVVGIMRQCLLYVYVVCYKNMLLLLWLRPVELEVVGNVLCVYILVGLWHGPAYLL